MLTAIKYNLAHLTDFHGRDARQTFWFYVLFLALVQFGISMVVSMAMGGSMMGGAIVAAGNGVDEAEMQRRIFAQVGTMMRVSMWTSAVLSLAMIGLLVAAFTRRLHDSGKPGWIAILVAVIQVVQLVLMLGSIDDMVNLTVMLQTGDLASAQAVQSGLALRGLLGWVPAVLLIVFGVWPSTPGENKYGPQPQAL